MGNRMTMLFRKRGGGTDANTLSRGEEHDLVLRWRNNGDKAALNRLAKANLGLVRKIAYEYHQSGKSAEDLIGEGNLGLTVGLKKFDPSSGNKICTYVAYWIRAYIQNSLKKTHGPVIIFSKSRPSRTFFDQASRATKKLELRGQEITVEALAREIGIKAKDVAMFLPFWRRTSVSLDAPIFSSNQYNRHGVVMPTVVDSIQTNGASPEAAVAEAEEYDLRKRALYAILPQLDKRERIIIRMRHLREKPATLIEVGRMLDLSREGARQIEMKALAKIRQYMEENGVE